MILSIGSVRLFVLQQISHATLKKSTKRVNSRFVDPIKLVVYIPIDEIRGKAGQFGDFAHGVWLLPAFNFGFLSEEVAKAASDHGVSIPVTQ